MMNDSALPARVNLALLILRIASGMVFLYHGGAILFGAFEGPGPQAFAAYQHWPLIIGYLVGLAQFGGGLAILSGILFRIGAAGIAIVMAGAVLMVHLPHGFDVSKGGMEFALTEFLMAIAFLLSGPGKYSLSALLPRPLRSL